MGKGDVKTKRGKIWRGSYGKKRPQLTNSQGKSDQTVKE
ncbi:30S ribosomal protein THX [Larkinella insperata]|uniref:30S ribosomal protein THX n=1 Tax=Larkinella insperata TaxID=332158 RepID=A0ABW3Q7C2_9BACT|nr:30S ribosomal protein THX [Larkinella insperata]